MSSVFCFLTSQFSLSIEIYTVLLDFLLLHCYLGKAYTVRNGTRRVWQSNEGL